MKYATIQDVQDITLKAIDIDYTGAVETLLEATSRFIDGRTGRIPLVSDEVTTRYYNGNDSRWLNIDLVREVTGVTVNGVNMIGQIILPTYWQEAISGIGSDTLVFAKGNQNIAVTGKFGYLTQVPDDLKIATAMLVGEILPGYALKGGVASERIGDYSISYDTGKMADLSYSNPFIKGTVEKYSKII